MAQWHGVSKRKPSGGRKRMMRGKRRTEISSEKQFAVLGESKRKKYRKTGASTQIKVLSEEMINVNNPSDGTTKSIKFTTVSKNSSNPNYVRRNILTKGAIVETELGKVMITSRPGQDGVINGTLIED
ncbi:MAG: 30S ribosomal protein S8e [Methanobacteriota archaeon]|nr:MAG: 30S ribosomal protein S8e [Euryarchaeota archaeon]|tara:strand:+ start:10831 stop:11214 length:384 start_codon:yes stop_codon:yes gene_type:complete